MQARIIAGINVVYTMSQAYCSMVTHFIGVTYTGWPKKVSHFQIIKTWYKIVLKPVNEIRFIRKIKV